MGQTTATLANSDEFSWGNDMTEMLSEQGLRNTIAEFEMANCMLTDFALLVAHDIRGGLRRVISYTELLAVLPALNGNLGALDCVHIIMASTRRIRLLADGALASPPQFATTVRRTQTGEPAENNADVSENRLSELKSANRDLTDFADSVARGLRTPLGQILKSAGHLSKLPAITANPVSLDITENILIGAQQMQRLIDDYLSFANAERDAIYRTRTSLESLIQLVRHELEPMSAGRNVTWRIAPLPEVEADASMLRQVLVNLLSNSLKYTNKSREAVIEIGVQSDPNEHIVFIRDNGIGFDLDAATILFEKFVRLQGDETVPGLGVGLVVVKHIIRRHRGRVWAEGTPDGGATFYFTLPVSSCQGDPDIKTLGCRERV
jgi:light-regulated signal transduction histidine kinase (bacteriophytochrome)